jgi:hypothetical protein
MAWGTAASAVSILMEMKTSMRMRLTLKMNIAGHRTRARVILVSFQRTLLTLRFLSCLMLARMGRLLSSSYIFVQRLWDGVHSNVSFHYLLLLTFCSRGTSRLARPSPRWNDRRRRVYADLEVHLTKAPFSLAPNKLKRYFRPILNDIYRSCWLRKETIRCPTPQSRGLFLAWWESSRTA